MQITCMLHVYICIGGPSAIFIYRTHLANLLYGPPSLLGSWLILLHMMFKFAGWSNDSQSMKQGTEMASHLDEAIYFI